MPLPEVTQCSELLAQKKWKIAFIESATAGRLSAEFSLTGQSGSVLLGGLSCYDACIKEAILHIPPAVIDTHTAESAEVTQAMAYSGAALFGADVTVAVTGLTTPGGSETPQKPVGTVFLHLILPDGEIRHREVFSGGAEDIVREVVRRTASLILERYRTPDPRKL